MTGAAHSESEDPALVSLLQRCMPMRARPPEGFPHDLWQRALLGPLREFLRRPGKEFRGQLVELSFGLAGGQPGTMPEELPLLLELLHAGSLIVDDIEDGSGSRRGAPSLHHVVGAPLALNAGNWLYFWPFELLSQMALTPLQRLQAHDHMHACLSRCHEGQALDLAARVVDLDQAQVPPVTTSVTALKTGSLVGLAMALGAVAAGASERRLHALHTLGCELGVALQMLDDLSGIANARRHHKGAEDLRAAKPTWAWAWLAQDLRPEVYAQHVVALERVLDDAPVQPLIEQLDFRLGVTGRRRACRQIERSVDAYRQSEGDHALLRELQTALKRLERGYVEG